VTTRQPVVEKLPEPVENRAAARAGRPPGTRVLNREVGAIHTQRVAVGPDTHAMSGLIGRAGERG
jgi:hypothetical protein